VQQAIRSLGYPRGEFLSPEGFQWITPTKSIKRVINVSDFYNEGKRKKVYDPFLAKI